jgi:surface antigen
MANLTSPFKTFSWQKLLLAGSLTGLSFAATLSMAAPSQASTFCQCVGYVKNVFGINRPVGNAKDMIYSLPRHGFRQISQPQPGAVVIMQPSFPGANTTYGHVGIINSIDGQGRLSVRGANQGNRNLFREAGCNNVNITTFRTSVNGRRDVTYWVR